MLRRTAVRAFRPTAPLAQMGYKVVQGFDYLDNKVKDRDISTPYEQQSTLRLTLTRQDEVILRQVPVKGVQLATTSGDLGVLPCHEYKISKLLPGVVSVEESDGKFTKFFASGGFAHINNEGSVDINTVECIPLEDLDLALAEKALVEASDLEKTGKTDKEKAIGQTQVSTLEAVIAALKAH